MRQAPVPGLFDHRRTVPRPASASQRADMTTIAEPRPVSTGRRRHPPQGLHVAAVVAAVGGVLATAEFPTTAAGYRRLLAWMRTFGELDQVGIEGTGTYGVSLRPGTCPPSRSRSLEVMRPNPAGPPYGTARPTSWTRSSTSGHVRQLDAFASRLLIDWRGMPRCCPAPISWLPRHR